MINPQWLELLMSRTNFHGLKDVRAIEVRLYIGGNLGALFRIRQQMWKVGPNWCVFDCVEVLRPSQPNGVMSTAISLPNHTFTKQASSSKWLTSIVHILSPETDNCPSWISGRERMTVEYTSWSNSTKECYRPRRGLNPRPPGLQSDGASNWATKAGSKLICNGTKCDPRKNRQNIHAKTNNGRKSTPQ